MSVKSNTKTVLITGASGYIGSHCALEFAAHGWYVVGVDRVSRDSSVWCHEFYECNINSDTFSAALRREKPAAIIHCAADIEVGESVADPAKYWQNNVNNTIAMLAYIKELRELPVVVFSSSAAVYGASEITPIAENSPLEPINPYGKTKLTVENVLRDYNTAYQLQSMSLRYFNAAGADNRGEGGWARAGQRSGASHIIARIIESQFNSNITFSLYGDDYATRDGTCVRDYVHVSDLASGHLAAVNYLLDGGRTTAVNLGAGHGTSNLEVIGAVEKYTGTELDYETIDRRSGDPDTLVADVARARRILGWNPVNSRIETIVADAYNWYQQQSKS